MMKSTTKITEANQNWPADVNTMVDTMAGYYVQSTEAKEIFRAKVQTWWNALSGTAEDNNRHILSKVEKFLVVETDLHTKRVRNRIMGDVEVLKLRLDNTPAKNVMSGRSLGPGAYQADFYYTGKGK